MEVLLTSMEGAAALHQAVLSSQSTKQCSPSRTAGGLWARWMLFVQMTSPLPKRVISGPGSETLTHSEDAAGWSLVPATAVQKARWRRAWQSWGAASVSICMQYREARSARLLLKGSYCCFTGSFGLFSGEPRRQAVKTEVSCSNQQA